MLARRLRRRASIEAAIATIHLLMSSRNRLCTAVVSVAVYVTREDLHRIPHFQYSYYIHYGSRR